MTATLSRTTLPAAKAVAMSSGLALAFVLTLSAHAQQPVPKQNFPMPGGGFGTPATLKLPNLPTPPAITPNGAVVEDVIARVNDQIITRSEYERSEQGLLADAKQAGATPADFEDRLHNLLRDMIDQQLLLSKGKELGITGDAETIRQLDEIRKQNHLDSMEALERAASQQGVNFEDFKQHIRNTAITQQVVRDEVGRRLNMTHASEEAYYNAHKADFTVPESVHLSEILIPTPENATDAQLAAAQAKADAVEAKLKAGAVFADLAKTASGGPTASAGGDLGDFKRGTLGDVLEKASFSLPAGGNTAPIRTRQGYVILHVDSHTAAGVPPLSAVEPQVEQAIYVEQLQPALRAYLTKARQDAYIDIKPGFIDTGSPTRNKASEFAYTSYTAPPIKKKYQAKQRIEQQKAAKAQAELAAARQKVAEKNAAKAAHDAGGAKNVSGHSKPKKIHREKIRFGEAPRNALPSAPALAADAGTPSTPVAGQAAGVAMAPTDSITSISTGTGVDVDQNDPLGPQQGPQKKTRFTSQETKAEVDRAKTQFAKAETKATIRPVAATRTESADEKVQGGPLGLKGDTVKKKKVKRQKGEPVQRLQEQQKPTYTPAPVAPTVNPALATPAVTNTPATPPANPPSSDRTVLPSAAPTPPGSQPQGQPIPATTSATPPTK
jgi:peptidyl-prolyl cis-trans isomerase SurA